MDAKVKRKPGGFEVILSKALYEKEAVFAAAYALSGLCSNRVEPAQAGYVKVTLEFLDSCPETDRAEVGHKFMNELIDQQLRLDLEKRYGAIRRLIVQQAFAPLDDLKAEVKRIVGRE
ncbi:MAG: His-Xaa-Ser system protein HxsD [Desulfobaccales bacterium]